MVLLKREKKTTKYFRELNRWSQSAWDSLSGLVISNQLLWFYPQFSGCESELHANISLAFSRNEHAPSHAGNGEPCEKCSPVLLLPLSRWKLGGYGKELPVSVNTLHNGHFLQNANSLWKGLNILEPGCVHAGVIFRKWKTLHLHVDRDAEGGGGWGGVYISVLFSALLKGDVLWGTIFFPQRLEDPILPG